MTLVIYIYILYIYIYTPFYCIGNQCLGLMWSTLKNTIDRPVVANHKRGQPGWRCMKQAELVCWRCLGCVCLRTPSANSVPSLKMGLHIGSMYGIYANIGGILMVNVTIHSIHGSYGTWQFDIFCKAQPRLFAATTGDDQCFFHSIPASFTTKTSVLLSPAGWRPEGTLMVGKVIPTRALNDLEFWFRIHFDIFWLL